MSPMQQLFLILSKVPIFVWPLFIGLVFVGIVSSRTREVPIALYYGLPFVGLAVLPTLLRLGLSEQVLITFVLAYAMGAALGFKYQKKIFQGAVGSKISIKGEWITMTVVMVIFFSNFVMGFLSATKPDLAADSIFITGFLCIVGICSGTFLGRSLRVIRLYRSKIVLG